MNKQNESMNNFWLKYGKVFNNNQIHNIVMIYTSKTDYKFFINDKLVMDQYGDYGLLGKEHNPDWYKSQRTGTWHHIVKRDKKVYFDGCQIW